MYFTTIEMNTESGGHSMTALLVKELKKVVDLRKSKIRKKIRKTIKYLFTENHHTMTMALYFICFYTEKYDFYTYNYHCITI